MFLQTISTEVVLRGMTNADIRMHDSASSTVDWASIDSVIEFNVMMGFRFSVEGGSGEQSVWYDTIPGVYY